MHNRRRCSLGLLAITLAACETGVPAPTVAIRDSAGVRIVESVGSVRHAASLKVGAPTFSVGRVDGAPEELLSRVVGAMRLGTDEIAIGNGGSHEVRFYDASGRFLRSEGREGQGPGEFEYMRALGRCAETGFVAFDLSWQMNAFDAEGHFVERTTVLAPDGLTPYNLTCDRQGRLLMLGWGRTATQGPRIGFFTSHDRLVLASRAGEVITDFGEWLVSERLGTVNGSRPHPAGRATVFAVHDDRVYVGSGERLEVHLYDLEGTPTTILRYPGVLAPITDSVKAAYAAIALADVPAERIPALRRDMAEWEWPEALPAYTELLVDPSGVAWLRNFTFDPSGPEVWSLIDPEGGYLGDVTLDTGASLLEIGADHLLVLRRDALGVESVHSLPLSSRDGAAATP